MAGMKNTCRTPDENGIEKTSFREKQSFKKKLSA